MNPLLPSRFAKHRLSGVITRHAMAGMLLAATVGYSYLTTAQQTASDEIVIGAVTSTPTTGPGREYCQ